MRTVASAGRPEPRRAPPARGPMRTASPPSPAAATGLGTVAPACTGSARAPVDFVFPQVRGGGGSPIPRIRRGNGRRGRRSGCSRGRPTPLPLPAQHLGAGFRRVVVHPRGPSGPAARAGRRCRTTGPADEEARREAHLPAQQPPPRQAPRVPAPHVATEPARRCCEPAAPRGASAFRPDPGRSTPSVVNRRAHAAPRPTALAHHRSPELPGAPPEPARARSGCCTVTWLPAAADPDDPAPGGVRRRQARRRRRRAQPHPPSPASRPPRAPGSDDRLPERHLPARRHRRRWPRSPGPSCSRRWTTPSARPRRPAHEPRGPR